MTNPLIAHFTMLAAYNRLANERLYDACTVLSDAERKRDRKGFFRSIHGTLNHIMVGDRIWLCRLAPGGSQSIALDAILYEGFDELRVARVTDDARIETFAAGLTDDFLARSIDYTSSNGRKFNDPAPLLVAHMLNHQTHHRGQVHDMLSQAGVATPVLDMHRVINPDSD